MLELLQIENVAVIEKAQIEFFPGLNVLTGETGAGKSIVIDALYAVTGGRASRELVRTGAQSAAVTAAFTPDGAEQWLAENGIEPDEGGALLLSRRITAEGKSVCRVNGAVVSAAQLRQLGALLLDIHGQNDGRKLMDEASHLRYLDGFAGTEQALEAYGEAYARLRELRETLRSLEMDEAERARRIDALNFQIEELENAGLTPGEYEEKTARRELVKNASRLTDALDEAVNALDGDRAGVLEQLGSARGALRAAARYADVLAETEQRLSSLTAEAQDIAETLRDFRSGLDFSPWEMDELEQRIRQLDRLRRKYGPTEEDMLAYLDRCRDELENISDSDRLREKTQKQLDKALARAQELAGRLSDQRREKARELEKEIVRQLSELNMKGVRFAVEFSPAQGEDGLCASGCDAVRFLMSANAGEDPDRISRIASGGELSRIMLAMKNVLAQGDSVQTMVFDEIDTGVSGIAAQRVGEKLSRLSRGRQVLCVTHLPQIAAMADEQFLIEKTQDAGRTYTRVQHLDQEGRAKEIARLTGGDNVTELTLSSAREQLETAKKLRVY